MMGRNTIQSDVRECVDDWLRGRRVNQRRQEGENKRENRTLKSKSVSTEQNHMERKN